MKPEASNAKTVLRLPLELHKSNIHCHNLPSSSHELPPTTMPQDMPPTGGYDPVQYRRNLPIKGFKPAYYLLGVGIICTYGFWRIGQGIREQKYGNPGSTGCSVMYKLTGVWCAVNWREKRCGRASTLFHYCRRKKIGIKFDGTIRSRRWRRSYWVRRRRRISVIGGYFSYLRCRVDDTDV